MYVALLRGINVGGKNKLPMKELVEIFERIGCSGVRTYIQSGNVIYSAPRKLVPAVPRSVADAIAERLGHEVPVVTRSAAELSDVAKNNPLLGPGVDPHLLHVAFLASRPGAARVRALDPDRSPPDEFAVRGREIYLRCPNGMARTRLTNAYFDARLATASTVRNWRTVLKLVELTKGG